MSPITRFWNLLNIYKIELRQLYIYGFFIGIVNLTLPIGIQAIINFLQTGELTTSWVVLIGFVLFGIATTGLLQVLQLRVVENIQQDIFTRSALEFGFRLPTIKSKALDNIHVPELANRFFDTLTIQKGLPKILIDFSLALFQIVFGLMLLAIYSPYFIILGIALSFILWLIFKITGPNGLETSLKESKYKYQLVYWLEEIARVRKSFKVNSASDFHLKRTDSIAYDYLGSREKHFKVLINQYQLFIAFKVFLVAGLLILGGYLVFNDQMNIGQFVAAEIIIILIINSVEKVIRTIDTIYDVLTALEKIGFVTDLALVENKGILQVTSTTGLSIVGQNIEFGFPGESLRVLENISFQIDSNEKVVIDGKSGSGKSLLLQIMAGILAIDTGEIYIDSIPFSNFEMNSFTQNIGVTLPTNQIFEGSIKENICFGRPINEQQLSKVIELLRLSNYINHHPLGIETQIDSGGRKLPRSIIQKLHIARAIVHEPKLLLLEDPLQFIEDQEKKRIIDYIMDDNRNWTVVVVSDFYYWKEKSSRIIDLTI